MYEGIDYSDQGIMKLAAISVYIVMMFGFFFIALSIPPESNTLVDLSLLFILIMEPFASILLGSLLGFLTKFRIRIYTDRMDFNDETRNLDEFNSVYYEGSTTANELVGHLPSALIWLAFLTVAPIVLIFTVIDFTALAIGLILVVSSGLFYPVGYYLTKRAAPIRTNMVKNPLYFRLREYLTIEDALDTFKKCQHVDHLIVKYQHAKSDLLNLIDNVRVFIVTKTDPILEIEITLENIQNIGLELTLLLEERLATQKEERISVDGTNALLIVRDTGMNTSISLSYTMNRFSERFALGNAKKNCNLLGALLQELAQLV